MPPPAGVGGRPRRGRPGRWAAGREEALIDSQSRTLWPARHLPRAALVAALAASVAGAACGGAIASPYPAARATEPVEDDSGLAGVAIGGAAAAGGGGNTGPAGGTPSGHDGGDDGGDAGDGNSTLIGLRLSAAGRAVMAGPAGGQIAWVAAVEEEADGRDLISLWPRDDATAADEAAGRWPGAAPALRIWVPGGVPSEVPLTIAIDAGDPEPGSAPPSWGRLRLDARPASVGPPPPDQEVSGEFEAHGPDGTVAGRFRAVRLARRASG